MKQRLKNNKFFSPGVFAFWTSIALAIGIFALLAHEVVVEKEDWFDNSTFIILKSHTNSWVIEWFNHLTFLGSSYFLFPAYVLIILFLFLKKRKTDGIDIMIVGLTSTALMYGLKNIYRRNRPDQPLLEALYSYSFPSGHSLSAFVFFSVLVFLVWKSKLPKKLQWFLSVFLVLIALMVGISRIVLRYHYASDVLAGLCLGFAWVMLSLWVQKRVRRDTVKSINARTESHRRGPIPD